MYIRPIAADKKRFIDLLLLADEEENMIDRYLERGEMFVLFDNDLPLASCVVTDEGGGVREIKSLATSPAHQRRGYASRLMGFIAAHYNARAHTLLVGTGDSPMTIPFYQKCGYTYSHRIPNFFTDHYAHPMFDNGKQLVDMIYLKKTLRPITVATADEYETLLQLWESSVRSTHTFLTEGDIEFYRSVVPQYFPAVSLSVVRDEEGHIAAFMGVSDELIEMLFVRPGEQGKGWGTQLAHHAIYTRGIRKVDVNEQNTAALAFYRHLGFEVTTRDEVDPSGKPYPILHMQLNENIPDIIIQ